MVYDAEINQLITNDLANTDLYDTICTGSLDIMLILHEFLCTNWRAHYAEFAARTLCSTIGDGNRPNGRIRTKHVAFVEADMHIYLGTCFVERRP